MPQLRRLAASSLYILDQEGVLAFLTLSYLAIVLVPSAVTALLLLLRVPRPWVEAQVVLVATLFGLYRIYLRGLSPLKKWIVLGAFAFSVSLALLAAGLLHDVSWDGNTYHSEAILGLLDGTNPIYNAFGGTFQLFTNHYPKVEWYFAAAMGGAFHLFELGKSYNFLLIFACGAYSWRFFRRIRLDHSASALLTTCTALNPIAATQILTFCVDGAMASLLSMLTLSSLAQLRCPTRFDRIVFVAVAAAAATTKFTGAAYVCVTLILVFAGLVLVQLRSSWSQKLNAVKSLLVTTALVAAAVLILGFNPYVTNVLEGNNPLYPVAGANKLTVISPWEAPAEFLRPNRNRFQNFAASFFTTTSETHESESPVPKIPFTVHLAEIKASTYPDLRMAGWGPLFSGVFVVSLALYLYARGWRLIPEISFAILLVLATTFSNPHAWWARFAPQISLLPILLLVPCLAMPSVKVNFLAKTICVLYLLNSLLFLVLAIGNSARMTWRVSRNLKHIYEQCGPGEYWYDGNKILTRYDTLPPYRGVSIHFRRATAIDLASSVSFPISLLRDGNDTLHIDHCAIPAHP